MRRSLFWAFRSCGGKMLVDFKLVSRDHRKSLSVEDAVVDASLITTVMPFGWLERLRSNSSRLPTGYFVEEEVKCQSCYNDVPCVASGSSPTSGPQEEVEAIRAGPVIMYITGENLPIVLHPLFVSEQHFDFCAAADASTSASDLDIRVGLDAIEQCGLLSELRPGGLLYSQLPIHRGDAVRKTEPVHEVLRRYGMKCGLSESPLNRRPWTRMKYMFIDELQRGPKMTEFVGYNPRSGTPWRFSQHNRYFRQGIWKEIVRRNEMNPGLHSHSSWQKSHQQAVPEVSFMAPYP